ncbi:NfeD family protein [Deinococcus sonorensis]|uniref:NfeD family protein n=2 Tax=Deinococcus sonorensis TaxID=309891 RepID=A0AAU7U570_9DEIO
MDWPTLSHVAPWHWWALAAVLLILEVLVPGVFLVWLGIAAAVLGLLVALLPLGVPLQLLLFGALSVVSILVGRRVLARLPHSAEADQLNRGAARLIGRTVVLTEPIRHGQGRARVGDGVWPVQGADAPAGSTVRIVAVQGTTLLVRPDGAAEALSPDRAGGSEFR